MRTKEYRVILRKDVVLRDCLYNLNDRSGASDDYCKGITVGIVSTLMAQGLSFKSAIDTVACYMPNELDKLKTTRLAVPDAWLDDLKACLVARLPLQR